MGVNCSCFSIVKALGGARLAEKFTEQFRPFFLFIMKRIVLVSMMAFITLCSQAQIYSSEPCVYLRAGADPTEFGSMCYVIMFRENKILCLTEPIGRIRSELKKNNNCLKYRFDENFCLTYDSSLSTSTDYVYKRYIAAHKVEFPTCIYEYPAVHQKFVFNKENSTLVEYHKKGEGDYKKYYFIRIQKSEIIAPGVNKNFIE